MAEYLVHTADERGHVSEHVEHAASVSELRDRFARAGFGNAGYVPLMGGTIAIHYGRKN